MHVNASALGLLLKSRSQGVAEIELSKANSLWSEEVGDVPVPTLQDIRFTSPAHPQPKNLLSPRSPGANLEDPDQDMVVKTQDILPKRLLDACMKKLPLATTSDKAIRVCTPDTATQAAAAKSTKDAAAAKSSKDEGISKELVEVVTIAGVGGFTRQQIESMRRVEILMEQCDDGEAFVKWLRVDVASSVPSSMREAARSLAAQVEVLYPNAAVGGLSGANEHAVAMLYRAKPPGWLDDAIISAFCERLDKVHPGTRYGGMPSAKKVSRTSQRIDSVISGRITAAVIETGVRTVIVPVNFGNFHWTAIIIDVGGKAVKYYDSMNACASALDQLAHNLIDDHAELREYQVVALNSPIQQDGYSCGLFVCFQFWREVDKSISTDLSVYAQLTRRLEFVHFVFHGSKIA